MTVPSTGLGAETKEFYSQGGAFDPTAASGKTDVSGQVILFNIPAPSTVSVSTKNALGTTTAQPGMPVRAGTISTVILTPNK